MGPLMHCNINSAVHWAVQAEELHESTIVSPRSSRLMSCIISLVESGPLPTDFHMLAWLALRIT